MEFTGGTREYTKSSDDLGEQARQRFPEDALFQYGDRFMLTREEAITSALKYSDGITTTELLEMLDGFYKKANETLAIAATDPQKMQKVREMSERPLGNS